MFAADPEFGPRSRHALRACLAEGGLIAYRACFGALTLVDPSDPRRGEARRGLHP